MRQFTGHLSIEHTANATQERVLKFLQVTNKNRTIFRWEPATLAAQPNLVFIDQHSPPAAFVNAPAHAFRIFVGEHDANTQNVARACHYRLEQDFTLMHFIDLLDRAAVKLLDRPRSQVVKAPAAVTSQRYRLQQWVLLPAPFNDVRHNKALGLMSIQAMSEPQLIETSGLGKDEITALLNELRQRQVLQVTEDSSPAPAHDGPPTTNVPREAGPTTLLGKLKRWVFSSREPKDNGPATGSITLTRRF